MNKIRAWWIERKRKSSASPQRKFPQPSLPDRRSNLRLFDRLPNLTTPLLPTIGGAIPLPALAPLRDPPQKHKGKALENTLHYTFFRNLILAADLDHDWAKAFEAAVNSLPISDLKDKLETYLEGEQNEDPPLLFLQTRAEMNLLSDIRKAKAEQEDLLPILQDMDRWLKEYRIELFPEPLLRPVEALPWLFFGLFFLFFFAAALQGTA